MSKAQARVFVPLVKVDEEQRLVHGVITAEELDQSGEVMDYETSKPNFESWSSQIEKSSGGLSKGNLRVMHGLNVAGKLTDIAFDDEAKQIEVCAKVVDDKEWEKVLEGCYTGFSVGGKYAKKWNETKDGLTIKKFTAVPNEVSLVDNPCVKSATFQLVKADGAEESVSFSEEILSKGGDYKAKKKAKKNDAAEAQEEAKDEEKKENAMAQKTVTNEQVAAKATEMAKAAGDDKPWVDFIEAARAELLKVNDGEQANEGEAAEEIETAEGADQAEAADDVSSEAVEKATPAGVKQVWTASDGKTFEKKADAVAHEELLEKAAVEPTAAEQLAERLRKAEQNEEEAETPSIFSFERIEDLHKAYVELETPRAEDGSPIMEKGMYTVSRFADMLRCTADLARTIKAEGKLEEDADDAGVAASLKAQLGTFGEVFMTYAQQQVAELIARLDKDMSPACAYDYYYHAAGSDNDLAKTVVEMMDAVKDEVPAAEEALQKAASLWGFVPGEPATSDETSLEDLRKTVDTLQSENGDLRKVAEEAVSKVEEFAKRLKKVEDTPLPRAPNAAAIALKEGDGTFLGKAVTTEEDKVAVLHDLLKTHGQDGLATMLIKASQASGGQKLSLKP